MSDTQKIVNNLEQADRHLMIALGLIDFLPAAERPALKPVKDMLTAAHDRLARRVAAHSNALEVQS